MSAQFCLCGGGRGSKSREITKPVRCGRLCIWAEVATSRTTSYQNEALGSLIIDGPLTFSPVYRRARHGRIFMSCWPCVLFHFHRRFVLLDSRRSHLLTSSYPGTNSLDVLQVLQLQLLHRNSYRLCRMILPPCPLSEVSYAQC